MIANKKAERRVVVWRTNRDWLILTTFSLGLMWRYFSHYYWIISNAVESCGELWVMIIMEDENENKLLVDFTALSQPIRQKNPSMLSSAQKTFETKNGSKYIFYSTVTRYSHIRALHTLTGYTYTRWWLLLLLLLLLLLSLSLLLLFY